MRQNPGEIWGAGLPIPKHGLKRALQQSVTNCTDSPLLKVHIRGQIFISKFLGTGTGEILEVSGAIASQPTQVIYDAIHWDAHMKIWNIKMKCALNTTDMFVRKTGVTKYRQISSVQYQVSDPKVGLSAKILNKSDVWRCTYYWSEPKAAASFKDYMPAQAVWHECRYMSCQHNVTSKTVSSQISKHTGKA